MADKVWTAKDIKMGKLILSRNISVETQQDVLTIIREYRFTNDDGNMGTLVPQRLVRELPWKNLPADMKAVFIKLHNYTRAQALKDQNME